MTLAFSPTRLAVPMLVVAASFISAGGVPSAGAAGPNGSYDWPGMKKCGSFEDDYRIYVYASRKPRASCETATRVMKAFWGPTSGTVVHGSGAQGYVTLEKYPGWKCGSGAGGGLCRKGRREVGYQN